MPFEFKKTEIEGLMLIKPHMYPDERGLYKKYYEKNIFAENGITCEFTESSDLYSKKGALRGLHYQTVDSQAKLIHVISGVLFDVALDLRENSPTFGQYHTELLKAEDQFVTYIPEDLLTDLFRLLMIRFSLISVRGGMFRQRVEVFVGMIRN